MTLGSRTASGRERFFEKAFPAVEVPAIVAGDDLLIRARWLIKHAIPKLKGGWMALAQPNWDGMFVSAEGRGAMPEGTAIATLTRKSQAIRERRRAERRANFLREFA